MASELVRRLIAANEGDKSAASGDVFYLAAERIDHLERTIEKLCDTGEDALQTLYAWMNEQDKAIFDKGHVNVRGLQQAIFDAKHGITHGAKCYA